MVEILVFHDRAVRGWNGDPGEFEGPGGVSGHPSLDVFEAMTRRYETDAHFVQYSVPGEPVAPRVNKSGRGLEAIRATGADLSFGMVAIDVDAPKLVQADPATMDVWRREQVFRRAELPWIDSAGYYQTLGGYRLVWLLSEPMKAEPFEVFTASLRAELRKYGIPADDNTSDWSRLFRVPCCPRYDDLDRDFDNLATLDWEPGSGGAFADIEGAKAPLVIPQKVTEGVVGGPGRNATLCRIAGGLRRMGMGGDSIFISLSAENKRICDPPLPDHEVKRIARNAANWEAGGKVSSDFVHGSTTLTPDSPADDPGIRFLLGSEVEIADHLMRDLEDGQPVDSNTGEALHMAKDRGRLWLYDRDWGIWREITPAHAQKIVAGYDGERILAGKTKDGAVKVRILKVKASLMRDTWKIAKVQRDAPGFFDHAPPGVTFRNGFVTVGPEGVTLHPFDPQQRCQFGLDFDYLPGAVPGRFLAFLRDCFAYDDDRDEKIGALREFVGAALLGKAPEFEQAAILTGEGANGKSTFMRIVGTLFPDYAVTAVTPQDMGQEYRRAQLARARLNVVNELPEADILASGAVKALITGDKINARDIREAPFDFTPRAAHLFAANTLPGVRDMSDGFWRRWIVVHWGRNFRAEGIADPTIADRIISTDLPALASWALSGASKALGRGYYSQSSGMRSALENWRLSADHVAAWIRDRCEDAEKADDWTSSGSLYSSYCQWVERETQTRALSQRMFAVRLGKLGRRRQKQRVRFWDLKLTGGSKT